jgi:hypothetical protein
MVLVSVRYMGTASDYYDILDSYPLLAVCLGWLHSDSAESETHRDPYPAR